MSACIANARCELKRIGIEAESGGKLRHYTEISDRDPWPTNTSNATMSEIIPFPIPKKQNSSDLDSFIDKELEALPKKARENIKFELIKTVDSYDAFFTEWTLSLPQGSDETLEKQIYDIAHQEHDRKLRMLRDIMKLKIKVLVAEYYETH